MQQVRALTRTGRESVLTETALQEFAAKLRGQMLTAEQSSYQQRRKVWNAMIDRRPALIARCAGVADVIHCVNFARDNDLLVSIRGGGHSVAGKAVCDGGLMIDLEGMKSIQVDAVSATAYAETGVTWGEFDSETQNFGLATTGGFVPSTGIAGLTLGGGLGYLMRRFGLTCDNLLSADVVTADGRLLKASTGENEDLFWALRGGGGNFGVVTSFKYKLHAVGPMVFGGPILHPTSRAKEVLRFYREFTATSPDELTTFLLFLTSPEGEPAVALFVCYSGPIESSENAVQPIREFAEPMADFAQPISYAALQAMGEPMFPAGRLNYWKSSFIDELTDDAINLIIDRFASVPSPYSTVALEQLGGAVKRIDDNETAFSGRSANYNFVITSEWLDLAENETNVRWTREFWESMRPFLQTSVYVNYLSAGEEDRIRDAYGPAKYDRLVEIKNKYDSMNLFRANQNIRPTAT